MPLIWTDKDWSNFNWAQKRVQPLSFKVNLALGAVKGRLMALPEALRQEVIHDIWAEEIAASAKIDRWGIPDAAIGAAVRNFGKVPIGQLGRKGYVADKLVKSSFAALRIGHDGPRVATLQRWHPDLDRTDWQDPAVKPMPFRDDATLPHEEMALFAVMPSQDIAREMGYIEKNLTNGEVMDLAALAACLHFWIVMVRPFVRGNGVMARLVTQVVLRRIAVDLPVLVPLSHVLLEERAGYFDRLGKAAWEGRDLTDWQIWHHQVMLKAAFRAEQHVKRAEVKQRLGVALAPLIPVQQALLARLVAAQGARVSVGELAAELGKSRSWIFRQMRALMARGMVEGSGPDKLRTYGLTSDWRFVARAV